MAKDRATTIERCAQVADHAGVDEDDPNTQYVAGFDAAAKQIAAAIRALATEKV